MKIYKDAEGNVNAGARDIALLDCLRENKTQYAESIALHIASKKDEHGNCLIPNKIKELFEKINNDLYPAKIDETRAV